MSATASSPLPASPTTSRSARLAVNDAAFGVSWALDGAFVLLGLGALATRALPRWVAGWAAFAGAAGLVGLAVPALFDVLRLAFITWALAASGWSLLRGSPVPAAAAGDRVPAAA